MNTTHDLDVIIVGSGAGGAASAHELVRRGLRVCILEKGQRLPVDGSTLNVQRVVRDRAFFAQEPWVDGRGRALTPEEHFNVGGKTRWYGAALLRMGSQEWGAEPAFGTQGWPVPLSAFEPYYARAERMLGVRDIDAEPGLAAIEGKLRSRGWRGAPLPMALRSEIAAAPEEAAHFDGFASVAGLKGDAETVFLAPIAGNERLTLLTGSEVVALLGDGALPLRVTGVRLADGRELRAPHVLLAAGALHSPRLLQRFVAQAGRDDGVGLRAGRGLKLHHLTALVALSMRCQTDLLRKTRIFTHAAFAHSSVQPLGFDGELIAALVPRIVPRPIARLVGDRSYGFFLQTEDATHPDNRVFERDAAGATERVFDYDAARTPVSDGEHRAMTRAFQRALLSAGFISFTQRIGLSGTAHACGTLPTGSDPAHSVVDELGRMRGIDGLYVVDGSALPRSGRVNPSLSIFAWSLRVADHLATAMSDPAAARAVA
jgi:choline dehydrogenase-like flavoprotein